LHSDVLKIAKTSASVSLAALESYVLVLFDGSHDCGPFAVNLGELSSLVGQLLFNILTREDGLKIHPLALGNHPAVDGISDDVQVLLPLADCSFDGASILGRSD